MIDETHTFSAGPGGCTAAVGPRARHRRRSASRIGGGIPCGAYGLHARSLARSPVTPTPETPTSSTSAASAGPWPATRSSLAAMRATLGEVLTDEAFARMIELGDRLHRRGPGGRSTERGSSPWSIAQLGARAEYRFARPAPRTGGESAAAARRRARRPTCTCATLNRGILMTPFHNMALMCPDDHRRRRRPATIWEHDGMESRSQVRNVAVLLAGGVGTRIGLGIPKQLIKIAGKHDPRAHAIALFDATRRSTRSCADGAGPPRRRAGDRAGRRVRQGRRHPRGRPRPAARRRCGRWTRLGDGECNVLLHDAVRPLVTPRIIGDCFARAADPPGRRRGDPLRRHDHRGHRRRTSSARCRRGPCCAAARPRRRSGPR